jgi:hypothetical protein
VTTIYPGRGDAWQPPVLAPAVEERPEKAPAVRPTGQEPETPPKPKPPAAPEVPVPEAPADEPPPPWTGTLM